MNDTPKHLTLVDPNNACYKVTGALVWGEWWKDTNNDSFGCKTTDKNTAYATCSDEDVNWYLRLDDPIGVGVTPTEINQLQRWSECKAGYTDTSKWCNFLTETIPAGGNYGLWWDTQADPGSSVDPSHDWDPTNDRPQLLNPCLDEDFNSNTTEDKPCKDKNIRVSFTGPRVFDNNHGWKEIHPVRKEAWTEGIGSQCYSVNEADQAHPSTCTDTGPTYSQVVDNADPNRFFVNSKGNWSKSSSGSQRYGPDYRYRSPTKSGYYAYYKVNMPTAGNYTVYAWWPARSSNNSRTAFWIWTASGWVKKPVDQRTNGRQWVNLGTYAMNAEDDWDIAVDYGYYSAKTGYIVADAVKIVPR
jgi:hypothetical protein